MWETDIDCGFVRLSIQHASGGQHAGMHPLIADAAQPLMHARQRPPAFQPGGQARVLFHGGPPMIVSIVRVRENRMITSWEYQLRDSAGAPVNGGAWIPQTRLVR